MNLTPNMKRLADDLTASRLSCEEEWPGLLVIWVGDDLTSAGIETGIEPHVMLADDWGEDTLRPYRVGYYSREEYEGNRDALWMATALNLAEARGIIGRAIAHAEQFTADHVPCPDCEYGWDVAQRRPCPTCHGTACVNRHPEPSPDDAQAACDWRQANSAHPCTPPSGDERPSEMWCPVAMAGRCPYKEDATA